MGQEIVQGQGVSSKQENRRQYYLSTPGANGVKALAVAVIAQAVSDLTPRAEVTVQTCANSARFLMDDLWQNNTVWALLALDGNEWLTRKRVDAVVASKLTPEAYALLSPRLRSRLQIVAKPTNGSHSQDE